MTALTELKIQEEFEKLLEEKFLDKITVVEIADRCEMNRNTFYYHYDNIRIVPGARRSLRRSSPERRHCMTPARRCPCNCFGSAKNCCI